MTITVQLQDIVQAEKAFDATVTSTLNAPGATVELFVDGTATAFTLYSDEKATLKNKVNLLANVARLLKIQDWKGTKGQQVEVRVTSVANAVGSAKRPIT